MALEIMHQAAAMRGSKNSVLVSTSGSVWVDGLGLVGIWADERNLNRAYYGAAQLDGEVVYINEVGSLIAKFSYDYADDGLLVSLYSGSNGRSWTTKPETNIWTHLYNYPDLPGIKDRVVRLPDRWLYAAGGLNTVTISSAPLDGSADWTVEHTFTADNQTYIPFPDKPFQGRVFISAAGGGLYWLGFSDGGLALYDAANKQVIESYKVSYPYDDLGYLSGIQWSRELGVFIATAWKSLTNYMTEIIVLSDETRPFALSDPAQLSTPARGSVTTMEVQLLGEHGDQVVDFPVDWSLTAGTGVLSAAQTLTGADGKAQVDYIPDNLASSGFTLQAEAQF
jgi:hypothetical protein